jgi:hypothetical protein
VPAPSGRRSPLHLDEHIGCGRRPKKWRPRPSSVAKADILPFLFSIRQSRDPFDGKQIVLYSASPAASHGQEHQSRTVSHLEDNGRKLIHQQFNQNPDGKEHLLMELILARKPARK